MLSPPRAVMLSTAGMQLDSEQPQHRLSMTKSPGKSGAAAGGQSDAVLGLFLSQLKLDEIAISFLGGFFFHLLQLWGAKTISSSSICSPLGD